MSFIFINECKNCKEKFEMKYKYWYSEEEIDLCENCFIESLSKEECRGTNKKLCDNINCKKCYLASFASHEKSKYWSKNNYQLTPRNVFKSCGRKIWFDCNCGHNFDSIIYNININNRWCSYCSNKKLCDNNDCILCLNKSFASHNNSKYWSDKNQLTPREVFKSSDTKYIFNCDCGHDFESILSNRSLCPYCSNPPKKLCDNNDCILCLNKSFASHNNSKYWSNKNQLTPREVFKNCNDKFWFNCDCGHDFETQLNSINHNQWCPYCSNPPKKLCINNDCVLCFNKSFASHKKSKYWSEKNKLTPREVFKNNHDKFWFNCEHKHIFEISTNNINKNQWCSICKNKTEKLIFEFLISLYTSTIHQYKPDWCKNSETNRHLPFDFFITELKIIIELDGRQHFEYIIRFQNNVDDNQDRDVYKSLLALQNGISVIRISQVDVWENKIDWKKLLIDEIEKIKLSPKPLISYIAKDLEIYREHIGKMKNI